MEQKTAPVAFSAEKRDPYRRGYLLLFNCATDALEQIAQLNFGQARQLLEEGQQKTEEFFLTEEPAEV